MSQRKPRIVLVEDSAADAEMMTMAIERAGIAAEVVVMPTGAQVLTYLGDSKNECDLMIVDLNLPLMTGFEVLEQVRSITRLKTLPIVIMSGSTNSEEIDRCYSLGANSYIAKPNHLEEIFACGESLMRYWFGCVKLPTRAV
jgi:CheY-like chemotaxis protein